MERIKYAIGIAVKNPFSILGVALIYSFVELFVFKRLAPQMATGSIESILRGGAFSFAFVIITYWALRIIFLTGFIPTVLASVLSQDNKVPVSFFKQNLNKKSLLNMTVLELVIIPVMFIGAMLLVVPGIFWFVLTVFAYFIVSSSPEDSVLDSISKSFSLTKGYRLKITGYLLIYLVVSFFASLTIPVMIVLIETFIKSTFFVLMALIYKEALEKNA